MSVTADANVPFTVFRKAGIEEMINLILWSDEDKAYVADVPELPGCMAHGKTYEQALKNARDAIAMWIESAQEFKRPIPLPKGRRLLYA